MWMNEWDIVEARAEFENHPVLSKATTFLELFVNEVNEHSDGWPYWKAPSHAADKLMTLIEGARRAKYNWKPATPEVTEQDFKKALIPIKSFYTRKGNAAGMKWPEVTK